MAATCYFMARMVSGDHKDGAFQQRMMRGRVGAQAATVLAMCFSGLWAGHRAKKEREEKKLELAAGGKSTAKL